MLRHLLFAIDGESLQVKLIGARLRRRVLDPGEGLAGIIEDAEPMRGRQEYVEEFELTVNRNL